jgi:mycofactocin precursor
MHVVTAANRTIGMILCRPALRERRISQHERNVEMDEHEVVVEVATPPLSNESPELPSEGQPDELVEEDLLIEDVSIDGMCGVY